MTNEATPAMFNDATVSTEAKRGCGFREVGGLYLVSGPLTAPCGRFPLQIERCAACGGGIKQSRGWTWIEPQRLWPWPEEDLLRSAECQRFLFGDAGCQTCPAGPAAPERAGLLWVGVASYPTVQSFVREAVAVGISRRISSLPRDYTMVDRVFLAHPRAAEDHDRNQVAGVFASFVPERVERVVKPDTPQAEVDEIRKYGETPVVVVRAEGGEGG